MNEHLLLYADGLCEPKNPGGVAAGGWLIVDGDGHELNRGCRVFCEGQGATNNVAEYGALASGLEWLVASRESLFASGFRFVSVRSDSQLAIYQTAGKWNCNKDHLRQMRDGARALLQQLKDAGFVCSLAWVPREQNEEADALSREAYRQHVGSMPKERTR
jgi:ribonuclease HI